jgi:hypothetical protein
MATMPAAFAPPRRPRGPTYPPAMLRQRIHAVRGMLDMARELVGSYADDPHNWHRRWREHMKSLERLLEGQHGAQFRERSGVTIVKMLGITASATSGPAAALTNWCEAAERKARAV